MPTNQTFVIVGASLVLAATLSAHGAAGLVGDGSATLHGDEFSGMTTAGPKAGRGVIVW